MHHFYMLIGTEAEGQRFRKRSGISKAQTARDGETITNKNQLAGLLEVITIPTSFSTTEVSIALPLTKL